MKNTLGIILLTAGVSVSVTGIIMYLFINQNYFNKEVEENGTVEIENTLEEEIDNVGDDETDDGIYQFLLDTKKVYCKISTLGEYYNNLKKDAREGKTDLGSKNTLILISKKSLEKANILGLDGAIESYANEYSNSPFSESANLMKLRYEYMIKAFKSTDKIGNDDVVGFFTDYSTYIDAANEAKDTLNDVLLQEYKAIRGEDGTIRPEEESKLLDLGNLCPIKGTEDESEVENISEGEN